MPRTYYPVQVARGEETAFVVKAPDGSLIHVARAESGRWVATLNHNPIISRVADTREEATESLIAR